MFDLKISKLQMPGARSRKNQFAIPRVVFTLLAFVLLIAAATDIPAQVKQKKPVNFKHYVQKKLKSIGNLQLQQICPVDKDAAAKRIFSEYGAIFITENGNIFPNKCIFENDQEVEEFQRRLPIKGFNFGGVNIELQEPAMDALLRAQAEATELNLTITPRGGSRAGRRTFSDTLYFWNTRFYPALEYWTAKGKISPEDAEQAKISKIREQLKRVFHWESEGFYFSTDMSKSILYSVAAPGTSQHLFMLALDVEQFGDLRIRNILAKHGWFQTVKSDLPHFTYLGVDEGELPAMGLKAILIDRHKFWIPIMD